MARRRRSTSTSFYSPPPPPSRRAWTSYPHYPPPQAVPRRVSSNLSLRYRYSARDVSAPSDDSSMSGMSLRRAGERSGGFIDALNRDVRSNWAIYYPTATPSRKGRGTYGSMDLTRLTSLFFDNPRKAIVCIKRTIRRQVLFAKRKAGFGGSAKKKRWRRTENSNYSC